MAEKRRQQRSGRTNGLTFAAERWLKRAVRERAAKDFTAAAAAAQRVIEITPDQCDALHLLAQIAADSGQPQSAIQCYRHLLDKHPQHVVAQYELGHLLCKSGAIQQAIACYQSALEHDPRYVPALCEMGYALLLNHDAKTAEVCLRRALALAPNDTAIRSRLAQALHIQQKTAAAIEEVQHAIRLAPKSANHHTDLGSMYAAQGDLQGAIAAHRRALQLEPGNAKAALNLASSKRFTVADESDIARIQCTLERAPGDPLSRRYAHLALAKVLDDRAHWEQAFAHCRQAHQPFAAHARDDAARTRLLMERIAAVFCRDFVQSRRGIGDPDATPVFIVGMPRSGTTLVENIIAAHPNAHAAGELSYIPRLVQQLAADSESGNHYPEAARNLTPSLAERYGKGYVQQLRQHHANAARIVDKLPGNHLYLGLIAIILHNAKIIYCRRDPCDIAVSIYFTDFTSGHHYAHDLGAIGKQINSTRKLMDHWRDIMQQRIITIDYETLVVEPESVGRALLSHIGLDWHPACLQPHTVARTVSTASQWQIRQPIYRHAVGRARHYRQHLDAVREALEAREPPSFADNGSVS